MVGGTHDRRRATRISWRPVWRDSSIGSTPWLHSGTYWVLVETSPRRAETNVELTKRADGITERGNVNNDDVHTSGRESSQQRSNTLSAESYDGDTWRIFIVIIDKTVTRAVTIRRHRGLDEYYHLAPPRTPVTVSRVIKITKQRNVLSRIFAHSTVKSAAERVGKKSKTTCGPTFALNHVQ